MSLNYSAHQYEGSFRPTRLGNWEVPKINPKPKRLMPGCVSEHIANERGHLYPEYKCGNKHPFCTYIGTYGMPRRITRELATELSQFPQHYDVINKTMFTPCQRENKSKQITSEQDRSVYRKMVRKCIEDNVDENIDVSELRDKQFVRKVKNCVDMEKQLAKIVKDCVLETIKDGNDVNADVMVSTVKKCVREKLGLDVKDDDEARDRIHKIVHDCIQKELKGKDILKTNTQDLKKNIKVCVEERLGRKSPTDKDMVSSKSDKNDALRKRVKACINELEPSEFDSSVKDKIKQCVKDKKQNEQKVMDKFEEDKDFRNVVRKCIEKHGNDEIDPAQVKESVKECVKNYMDAKNKPDVGDELRKIVKQCMKENENEKLDSKQMKQRIKDCVENLRPKDGKEANKEKQQEDKGDNKQVMMRKAVQDCLEKHKSKEDKLNEAEFKETIKTCADDNLKFRQAVREIPKKDNIEKTVKEMIKEKKNKTDDQERKGKEFRSAVQECMKEKRTDKNTPDSEFKKIVKDCALQKIKGK